MKGLVYQGPGKKAVEDRPNPDITAPTDAIVKIVKTTICGTTAHSRGRRADLRAGPHLGS
jgi:alcohol dehydrogenase